MESTHKTYEKSQKGFQANLDLFNLPKTNFGIVGSTDAIFYPTNFYRDNFSPLNFVVHSPSDYFDPQSCFIYMELVVRKTSTSGSGESSSVGPDLTDKDLVAVTSNLGAAMFSSVEVLANGIPYIRPSPYVSFVSHIQDLIYVNKANKPQLELQLYHPDTIVDQFVQANTGFTTRRKLCAGSKRFYCVARITDPLFFNQPRFIIPDTHLSITLRRSPAPFVLDGKDSRIIETLAKPATETTPAVPGSSTLGPGIFPYQLILESCHLQIKKFSLNPQLARSHAALLGSGQRANYPLRCNDVKVVPIPISTLQVIIVHFFMTSSSVLIIFNLISLQYQTDVVFSGALPRYVLLTFVENAALGGSLGNSTFTFKHFGIESAICQLEGEQSSKSACTLLLFSEAEHLLQLANNKQVYSDYLIS